MNLQDYRFHLTRSVVARCRRCGAVRQLWWVSGCGEVGILCLECVPAVATQAGITAEGFAVPLRMARDMEQRNHITSARGEGMLEKINEARMKMQSIIEEIHDEDLYWKRVEVAALERMRGIPNWRDEAIGHAISEARRFVDAMIAAQKEGRGETV